MSETSISAPKGVYDVFGEDVAKWDVIETRFFEAAARCGYRQVRIPVIEYTELFVRSVGETTDVVRKEMFTIRRGDYSLTLRPEGTAGVVRCFVQHRLDQAGLPWKASYGGPMFRAEEPQAGRNRQFAQLGVEAVGVDDAALDVEVIELAWRFLEALGLRETALLVNSIGRPDERRKYIGTLAAWARRHVPDMGPEDRARLESNPLRLLDSKDARMVEALAGAPTLLLSLGTESRQRYERVLAGLDSAGIPHVQADRLVRGLDYYTATTFELQSASIPAAQNALGGGGHYDGLVADLGGPALPGIGFALGVDRIVLAGDAEGIWNGLGRSVVDVVVLGIGETAGVPAGIVRALRGAGIRTDTAYGGRSLKAQMTHANRLGATTAVIVGERDLANGQVTVRDLETGEQQLVPVEKVTEAIAG